MNFPIAEYRQRLANVRKSMAAEDIELLAVSTPENIYYLSGYSATSYYSHQTLLVPLADVDPVLLLRGIDLPCAAHTSWLSAANRLGYDDSYVDSIDRHPWSWIARQIQSLGWPAGRIGMELDGYFLSPKAVMELARARPKSEIVDTTMLINLVRAVKSDAELAYMRQAAIVADAAMQAAFEVIRPGVRECDAMAQIVAAQIAGTTEYGGHAPSEPVLLSAGKRADSPHLYWSDDPFEAGSSINVELGGVRAHYNVGLARTLSLGSPPAALQRLVEANSEAMDAALAAVRPGIVAEEIEGAYRAALARHGYAKPSRVGYTIGIGICPAWMERAISLRPGDLNEIKLGMTFHLMAGMWQDDVSCVLSETFIVTDPDAKTLSTIPRDVHIVS